MEDFSRFGRPLETPVQREKKATDPLDFSSFGRPLDPPAAVGPAATAEAPRPLGPGSAAPPPEEQPSEPWAITRGFMTGLLEQNPDLFGEAADGLGIVTGSDTLRSAGQTVKSAVAGATPEAYKTRAKGLFDSGSLDEAFTALGEMAGSGFASVLPGVAASLGGAAVGGAAAGPAGAVAGGAAGAYSTSYLQSYGELFKALKAEGVDEERAANVALAPSAAMAALDAIPIARFTGKTFGIGEVKREVARRLAKRIAQEGGAQAATESITEMAQEVVKEATVALETGQDFFTVDTLKSVGEAGVGGALVGGPMGAAGGIRRDRVLTMGDRMAAGAVDPAAGIQVEPAGPGAPPPTGFNAGRTAPPVTGNTRQEPTGLSPAVGPAITDDMNNPPPPVLPQAPPRPTGIRESARVEITAPTPEDEASPIDTGMIQAGKQAIADAMAGRQASAVLESAGAPGVGQRVTLAYPDGRRMSGVVDDAYEAGSDEFGREPGVRIRMDDGTTVDELVSALPEMGVRLTLEGMDDPVDAVPAPTVAPAVEMDPVVAPAPEAAPAPAVEPAPVAAPAAEPAPVSAPGEVEERFRKRGMAELAANIRRKRGEGEFEAVAIDGGWGLRKKAEAAPIADTATEVEDAPPPPVPDETVLDSTGRAAEIDALANEAATSPLNDLPEPTQAQKEAGNYKVGKVRLGGLDISVENPKGSVRSGVDPDGEAWETTLPAHYGRILRTKGADGDHVDVYIGEKPDSNMVVVFDQYDPKTGKFDEHKAVMGVESVEEATAIYDGGFSDGTGPNRRRFLATMPVAQFREWALNGDTARPLKEQGFGPATAAAEVTEAAIEVARTTFQDSPIEGRMRLLTDAGVENPSRKSKIAWGYLSQTDRKALAAFLSSRSAGDQNPVKPGTGGVRPNFEPERLPDGEPSKTPIDAKAPRPTKPVDLVRFLQGIGGVKDPGGELKAMGLDRYPGLINNRTGRDPDKAREAAAEAGYFGGDPQEDIGRTTTADLFDLLSSRKRIYKPEDSDRVAALERPTDDDIAARNDDEADAILDAYEEEIGARLDPVVRKRARKFVAGGWDTGDAVERASIEEEGDGDARASDSRLDDDLPFDVDPADRRPRPMRTETVQTADGPRQQGVLFGGETLATPPRVRQGGEGDMDFGMFAKPKQEEGEQIDIEDAIDEDDDDGPRPLTPAEREAFKAELAAKAKRVVDFVAGGGQITIPSFTRPTIIRYAELLRAGSDGLYVKRGKSWDYIPSTSLNAIIAQLPREQSSNQAEQSGAQTVNSADARLVDAYLQALQAGEEFNINRARKMADGILDGTDDDTRPLNKRIEEAMEAAVVRAARAIVADGESPAFTYRRLRALYQQQPLLAQRTSASVENQAYSTPAPLAYIASRLAGAKGRTVYEPSAGNGMLLLEVTPADIIANELDPKRAAMLREILPDASVHVGDGATYDPGRKVDVVLANPPFGKVWDQDADRARMWDVGGVYKTPEIDHAISWKALESMRDDGRAVLIIGGKRGTDQERVEAYRADKVRAFFKTLYDGYNVVDHFTVDGKLYERQGASWPVDVIVIDGRGASTRDLPMRTAPRVYESWTSLEELFDARDLDPARQPGRPRNGVPDAPAAEGAPAGTVPGRAGSADRPAGGQGDAGGRTPAPGGDGGERGADRQPGSDVGGRAPGGEQRLPAPAGEVPDAGGAAGRAPRRPGGKRGPRGGNAGGVSQPSVSEQLSQAAEALAQAAEALANQNAEPDVASLVNDELDAIFGAEPAPVPAPAPAGPRSASQAAASAVKNTAMSAAEIGKGLTALFGGNKLSSGLTFDEESYQAAKPYFTAAVQNLGAAGRDVRDMVKAIVRYLAGEAKMDRATIQTTIPYIERFVADVREGSVDPWAAPAAEPASTEAPAAKGERAANTEAETAFQVQYAPTSKVSYAVGTLVPRNMQTAMSKALTALEERVGAIDAFVAERLDYSPAEVDRYFSAEQVDALALAIDNVEKGAGFVIGDQTGVGKGRFVAAMLRFGLKQNRTPVFFTKDPGLYGDMVRDLRDIGMPEIASRILVTNDGLRSDKAIPLSDEPGDVLTSPTSGKLKAAMQHMIANGSLPDGYDMLFTTYSQVQYGPKGRKYDRQVAIESLAGNAMVVLDESHEAGGTDSKKFDPETGEEIPSRSDYVRGVLRNANGVVYSSATYAKNPTVMSLYFKTDLSMAVENIDTLAETITAGGVPLQQVMANMLVEAGQYARRERSYEGVEIQMDALPTDEKAAEAAAGALRQVFALDTDFMEEVRQTYIDEAEAEGELGGNDNAIGEGSASGTGFAQVMHNVVSQMLLALKAPAVVDKAIELAKSGEKPIIALSNTNESILADFIEETGLKPGQRADLTFNTILERYLRRLRRITLKAANGEKSHHYLTDEEIELFGGEEALQAYQDAEDAIRGMNLSGLPASPVDYILDRLNAAGVKAGEITGRQTTLTNGVYTQRSATPAEKKKAMNAYNRGDLDALVINRSGSTGFSMHATGKKGNDGKQRHMIVLQPDSNIDVFMQMLGRIHRTGQIKLPRYTLGVSNLAVEKRAAAVLMRKMASLNANTTASKRSAVSLDAVDFLNRYGDEVVADYLRDNPDVAELTNVRPGLVLDGLAAKLTGRLAIMPPEQVSTIYADIEVAYTEYLEALDRMGLNALEAKTLDLDARTLKTDTLVAEKGDGASPFQASAQVETVDVKRLGKPYTLEEVETELDKVLGGKDVIAYHYDNLAVLRGKLPAVVAKMQAALDRANAAYDEATTQKQKEKANVAISNWQRNITEAEQKLGLIERTMPRVADHILVTAREGEAETKIPGRVLDVDISKVRDNPLAASAIKVRIALADPSREISIPLSQMMTADPGKPARYDLEQANQGFVEGAFKAGGQELREERQIITGNLVAGYATFKKGQFIMFKDADGATRQGILMPRNFNAANELAAQPVRMETAKQIAAFLADEVGRRMVKSSDDIMGISKTEGLGYNLVVRVQGGKPYYLLKAVRDIVGDFEQRRGQKVFRAQISGWSASEVADKLDRVIRAYQDNLGTTFEVTASKDEARAAVEKNPAPTRVASARPRAPAPAPVLTSDRVTRSPNLKALADEIMTILDRVAGPTVGIDGRARFGAGVTSDEALIASGGQADSEVFGYYDPAVDTIALAFMPFGRPAEPDSLKQTAYHEAFHRLQFRFLTDAQMTLLNEADPQIVRYIESRGFKAPGVMFENQAYAFETYAAERERGVRGDETGLPVRVRMIFDQIRRLLERVRNLAAGRGFTSWRDVMDAAYAGDVARQADRGLREDRIVAINDQMDAAAARVASTGKKPIEFTDQDVEKRFQEARKGLGKETLRERLTETAKKVGAGFTRRYLELPNSPRFAEFKEQLRKLEAAPNVATETALRHLTDMTKKMTPADFEVFTRKVILDDLSWEVDEGRQVAFGFTKQGVKDELKRIDAFLAAPEHAHILDAVRDRKAFVRRIANDMVRAGVLSREQVKNPAYFRHQVLEYARLRGEQARRGDVSAPKWARRMGSTMDINANLLEAEFEWLHKAITDTATARVIDWLDNSVHNVRDTAIQAAKARNAALVQEVIDADIKARGYQLKSGRMTSPLDQEWTQFRMRIGLGFAKIRDAIDSGGLKIPAEHQQAADAIKNGTGDEGTFGFLAWMLDTNQPGAMGAAMILKAISGRRQWMRDKLGEAYTDPTDIRLVAKRFAPEGFTTWQPDKGKLMFTAQTVPEHVLQRLRDRIAADPAGYIPAADMDAVTAAVRSQLVVGGDKYTMIVPNEVAGTLDNFRGTNEESLFRLLVARALTSWKMAMLFMPHRILKYNINNMSGDADAMIAGRGRKAFRNLKPAAAELYAVMMKGETPSQRYRDAVERGVFDSGLSFVEIPDLSTERQFRRLFEEETRNPLKRVYRAGEYAYHMGLRYTTLRENIARYAAYISYLEEIDRGDPMEKIGYGAAVPQMVDALTDPKDKAAALARALLGDYQDISKFGQAVRTYAIPFYSWMEMNFRRYTRLSANALELGIGKSAATPTLAKLSGGALLTGKLYLRMLTLYVALAVWNNLLFGDQEDELDELDQQRLHINLGKWGDEYVTLKFQGALSDFVAWFGFPDVVDAFKALGDGKGSLSEVAGTLAKAPANKVAQGLGPHIKLPIELTTGLQAFPDVFEPRGIRDRWAYFFQSLALGTPYNELAGLPSRGFAAEMAGALFQKRDPGEIAYNRMLGLGYDWLEKEKGQGGIRGGYTERSNAVYFWKQAQKWGDKDAERVQFQRMRDLGMTRKDIVNAIKRAHPLGMIALKDRGRFLRSLEAKDRESLNRAVQWYRRTYRPTNDGGENDE